MAREDGYTIEFKKRERYSDFATNFDLNPVTGYLAKVTNEDSVAQSMRNIVLTATGERFYDMNKGSRIRHSLFEPNNPETIELIKLQLRSALNAYEPRAIIHQIRMNEDVDSNQYNVSIVFSVINIPKEQFSLDVAVARVR